MINIGTGIATNTGTVARKVVGLVAADRDLIQNIPDRPGQVDLHISSTDKAERLLGWRARTTFDAGLERTVAWYRENETWWRQRTWMRYAPVRTPDGTIVMH